ncbi:hypothetical protein TNCV_2585751 [Trichonephila clavipes]|nr:hypothetical protein TNCV_2585751 [Trichonephila clavipes]
MFTNEMKEKSTRCVDTEDLDDDTIQTMLQYMYTATIPDLKWGIDCNLYAAADKYEILSLKSELSKNCKTYFSKRYYKLRPLLHFSIGDTIGLETEDSDYYLSQVLTNALYTNRGE